MKPRMKIFLRQKKVTTQLIAKSLANVAYDIYKPTFTVSLQLCEVYFFVSGLDFKAGTEKQKPFLFQFKSMCYSTNPITVYSEEVFIKYQSMHQFYQKSPRNYENNTEVWDFEVSGSVVSEISFLTRNIYF